MTALTSDGFVKSGFMEEYATFNHVWAALMLEELYRLGVRDVVLAPGSRSSPLTMSASEHAGLRCHCHFDERGLGFMALGHCPGQSAARSLLSLPQALPWPTFTRRWWKPSYSASRLLYSLPTALLNYWITAAIRRLTSGIFSPAIPLFTTTCRRRMLR